MPVRISIQYRWGISSGGLVVEADDYQGRLHDEVQERPARHRSLPRGLGGLGDRMSKEGDLAGVLDDPCGPRVDRLAQLTAAIEAMHLAAQRIARLDVLFDGRSHLVPWKFGVNVPDVTDSGSRVRSPSFIQRQSDFRFPLGADALMRIPWRVKETDRSRVPREWMSKK